MNHPLLSLLRQTDTHRLVPAKASLDDASVLSRIAENAGHLADIFDLDHASNDRLIAENDRLPGIGVRELVFDVPNYRIINAAFCHANPLGSRFNGPQRGAWYAAFELRTAQAEIAFYKSIELAEVGWFHQELRYDDYLADFSGEFHDLRAAPELAGCLAPESYLASQELAESLLAAGSLGVTFPSVRRAGGTCLVCFRPALVNHVRKGNAYLLRWMGTPEPSIEAWDASNHC